MTDLLVQRFNARAQAEGFKIKLINNGVRSGWHLQTCLNIYECHCQDLLHDSGCIFDDLPTHISVDDGIHYFNYLARKYNKPYILRKDGHMYNCIYTDAAIGICAEDQHYECVCIMLRKNPEQFFKIPLHDRYKPTTSKEIKEL